MRITLVFFFILTVCGMAYPQVTNRDNYDLRNPGNEITKKCSDLNSTLRQIPNEDRFSTRIINDSVFVLHSNEAWFWRLFPDRGDGIAIDLVSRDQYQCDNITRISGSWSHKGFLLQPLYRDDIKKNLIPVKKGYVAFFAGKVPRNLMMNSLESGYESRLEVNYLVMENKYLCQYVNIVNVDSYGWDLLKNGLYYDTLSSEKLRQEYQDISKTLHFTIPFEKDKSEYKETDIRPLYDSLKLTDYEIKSIRIHTYTSVEGAVSRNQKLQKLRAESIVKALQSFQPEKLESTISYSENWVEFLEDIQGSSFENLMALSKNEIKEKLQSSDLLKKIEPVLSHHRKGIVELDLEKRILYLKSNGEQLKKYFNQELAKKNIEEALYLQQIIFYKIQKHELPDQFLNEIDLPEALEFGSLLLNNASFLYENSFSELNEAIATFEKLNTLLKNNSKIKYNLCVLKLKAWLSAPLLTNFAALKNDIESLRKMGIPQALIRRLLINYNIILSEVFTDQKKYADKDKAVKFIHESYKSVNMNDADLVNLAKYFAHNSKFDWAEKILEPRMKSVDVSEDALFYYLSLTIFYEKNTKNPSYRTFMLNAINANSARFCKVFNSIRDGGVSFQLLSDPYLKKTYCENCNNPTPDK